MKLTPPTRQLLYDVLARREPGLLSLLDATRPDRAEIERLRELLTIELAERGFDSDYAPTRYGSQIEEAIDELHRLDSPPTGRS